MLAQTPVKCERLKAIWKMRGGLRLSDGVSFESLGPFPCNMKRTSFIKKDGGRIGFLPKL